MPCAERRIGRKAARGEHRRGRPEDAAPSVRILGRNARDASLRIKHEFPEGESLQDRHARIQSRMQHGVRLLGRDGVAVGMAEVHAAQRDIGDAEWADFAVFH